MMNILSPAKINTTKLLPGASSSALVASGGEETSSIKAKDLIVIKTKVIQITDLIKTSTLLKQAETEKLRVAGEEDKAEKREEELEKKPDTKEDDESKFKLPKISKPGFFGRIEKFFTNILLGYAAVRLLPYVDKLPIAVGAIGGAIDFGTDLFIKMFDGFATFVEKGYEAHDATVKFLKGFGGDGAVKAFDMFNGAVGNVITAAIAASMALSDMGGDDGGGGGDRTQIRGRRGSPGRGRYGVDPRAAKRYAERYGKNAAIERFGEEGVRSLGGKYARSELTNLARKGLVGALGKGGTKTALRIVKPLVKNIPLIGGIMEFVLSWMSGDSVGKAAFKGVGAGLGTWVGGALGTLIGGPIGAGIGMWLGSEGGSSLGGLLYDKIFGDKDPGKKPQVAKAAGGGSSPTTRGGKLVGAPVARTVKKQKTKRTLKVQPTDINPGKSVGGEDKIKKIFPEVETKNKGKNVNPLGYMKSSYDKNSSAPGFGGLAALFMKAQLGERPSDLDYQNAAAGLEGWMQKTFSDEVLRTGGGFAEGGQVDAGMFSSSGDMRNMIAKSIQDSVAPKIDDTINDLMKQLGLKEIQGDPSPGKGPDGSDPSDPAGTGGDLSGDDKNKFMQVALAAIKAGDVLNGYVTATQFAQESGWGKTVSGKNNYFGQKGTPGTPRRTREVINGKDSYIVATFKDYPSLEAGIADHVRLWKSTYASAKTPSEAFRMLKAARYATDPDYVSALSNVYRTATGKPANEVPTDQPVVGAGRPGGATGPMGISSGTVADRPWNTGIKLTRLKTRSGITYRVASILAQQFSGFVSELEATGYKIKSIGGWREAGTGGGSGPPDPDYDQNRYAHPYGAAIDINPAQNPYSPSGKNFKTDFPSNISAMAAKYGLGWGGNWRSSKDTMHFSAMKREGGNKDFSLFNLHGPAFAAKGGRINRPTLIIAGEKGPEFMFDADTTSAVDSVAPGLLEQWNAAKTKKEIASILQSYAGYEDGGEKVVYVVAPEPQVVPMMMPIPMGGGIIGGGSGSPSSDYDSLAHGH